MEKKVPYLWQPSAKIVAYWDLFVTISAILMAILQVLAGMKEATIEDCNLRILFYAFGIISASGFVQMWAANCLLNSASTKKLYNARERLNRLNLWRNISLTTLLLEVIVGLLVGKMANLYCMFLAIVTLVRAFTLIYVGHYAEELQEQMDLEEGASKEVQPTEAIVGTGAGNIDTITIPFILIKK